MQWASHDVLRLSEVEHAMGQGCSTIYAMMEAGRLSPASRCGQRAEVIAWVQAVLVMPTDAEGIAAQ